MNLIIEINGVRYKHKKLSNKVPCKSCALKEICGSHYWMPDMCSDLDFQIDGMGYFIKEEQ